MVIILLFLSNFLHILQTFFIVNKISLLKYFKYYINKSPSIYWIKTSFNNKKIITIWHIY